MKHLDKSQTNSEVMIKLFLQLLNMAAQVRSFQQQQTNMAQVIAVVLPPMKRVDIFIQICLPLLIMLEAPASSSPVLTPSRMDMLVVHLYPGKLVAFQPSSEAKLTS